MEKYLSIRVQTALYISIFFVSMHHVFVYLTNSSVLKYTFGLKTNEVLAIYGIASLLGICVFLAFLRRGITSNVKKHIYVATFIELICLAAMYYSSLTQNRNLFIGFFFIHHMLTPFILFNLDELFEAYTNVKDRGRSRGIYLTVWNLPFVIIPLIMSTLSVEKLPVVYMISSFLLLPFLYLIFYYIKNPSQALVEKIEKYENVKSMLATFFNDPLDRRSFITQTFLHLYYGSIAVMLPIYLHSVFLFDWDKIGLILTAMTAPFILIQIPFGNIEDKRHNERGIFKIGLSFVVFFSICLLLVSPQIDPSLSFLLISGFLFLANIGCSLVEISTESMFYKHVTEQDHTALLMFRMARILPYSLGILALFFI